MQKNRCWILLQKSSTRGASAVELALVMPIMVLVFLAMSEYGLAFYDSCSLDGAARAALGYALKNPADTTGITTVAQSAGGALTENATVNTSQFCECPPGGSVSCTTTCTSGTLRKYVQVTMTINYSPPFKSVSIVSPPAQLTAQATMRTQ